MLPTHRSRRSHFSILALSLLAASTLVQAHGGHSHGEDYDTHGADAPGTEEMGYAERHMRSEHHIDAFDGRSFFALHDLNQDGILDVEEIQAIYGLHHDASKSNSPNDGTHKAMAQMVVDKVLEQLDTNKDGVISLSEFLAGGGEGQGLPDFKGVKELGHHYDEESEYFLHHEEKYHSTPETQTDESYIHPEDIAHFEHHEHIDDTEDAKAKAFIEGETETHADMPHEVAAAEADAAQAVLAASQAVTDEADTSIPPKTPADEARDRAGRRPPSASERYKKAMHDAAQKEAYGTGDGGFKRPRTAAERMRHVRL